VTERGLRHPEFRSRSRETAFACDRNKDNDVIDIFTRH
jgi:hypothetical protein